jgi:hypothetical protein
MDDVIPVIYQCAFCGRDNETLVDPTVGSKQSYTEDCEICCNPNLLTIIISSKSEASVSAEQDE